MTQSQRTAYFAAVVNHLLHERGLSLVALAKARFKLAQDHERRVRDLQDAAATTQFRQLVLAQGWVIEPDWAHLLNDPYEIEKRLVGELWARNSQRRCLFGLITKDRNGLGVSGQLDALFS